MTGRRPGPLADAVEAGDAALDVQMDVASPSSVADAVDRVVATLGPVDLLVNNAGTSGPLDRPPWEQSADDWWRVLEVNLRGPQLCTNAVLPSMLARGTGRIVNVGSGLGLMAGPPSAAVYGASKAALHHLTRMLATGTAGTGVTVLAWAPGLARTEMTAAVDLFDHVPDEQWSPVEVSGDVAVRIALGDLDRLSGRLLNARQPVDRVLERVDEVLADDLMIVDYRDPPWAPWSG